VTFYVKKLLQRNPKLTPDQFQEKCSCCWRNLSRKSWTPQRPQSATDRFFPNKHSKGLCFLFLQTGWPFLFSVFERVEWNVLKKGFGIRIHLWISKKLLGNPKYFTNCDFIHLSLLNKSHFLFWKNPLKKLCPISDRIYRTQIFISKHCGYFKPFVNAGPPICDRILRHYESRFCGQVYWNRKVLKISKLIWNK
jgi:hypothetical protein